jgi:DNA-binding GntR family transcriptional regulator
VLARLEDGGRTTMRRRVAEQLRASLISGELRPGSVYSAPDLAGRFGTSATPVREAMLDLVKEGLVEVVPNTGFRIRILTQAELDEIAETRTLLEVPIMGEVAEKCVGPVAEQVEGLRGLAQALLRAAKERDLVEYMRLDTDFHLQFLALHGNATLVEQVASLRYRSRLFGLEALAASGNLEESTKEHETLVDLALARDREGIESLMKRHIGHTRREWASQPSQ